MEINWLLIVAGTIPYSIKRQKKKGEQHLTVKALFWQLTIHQEQRKCSWDIYVPFIEHLRQ